MSNLLSEFWCRLDGAVHPDDVSVFERYRGNHGFKLDYPPPAFWGNVEQARILILGGMSLLRPSTTKITISF
jgi:hypothetical protein